MFLSLGVCDVNASLRAEHSAVIAQHFGTMVPHIFKLIFFSLTCLKIKWLHFPISSPHFDLLLGAFYIKTRGPGSWCVDLYLQLNMVLFIPRADTCLLVSPVNNNNIPSIAFQAKISASLTVLSLWMSSLNVVETNRSWVTQQCRSTRLCARHASKFLITVTHWMYHLFIDSIKIYTFMHTSML